MLATQSGHSFGDGRSPSANARAPQVRALAFVGAILPPESAGRPHAQALGGTTCSSVT